MSRRPIRVARPSPDDDCDHCLIWVQHPNDPNCFMVRCAHCTFRTTDWLIDSEPGTADRCADSQWAHSSNCANERVHTFPARRGAPVSAP
jgi:hypothetical protein